MNEYEYEITTEQLSPPIGGMYRYAARVAWLLKRISPTEVQPLGLPKELDEQWAGTEEEARKKIQQAVEAWIARQK